MGEETHATVAQAEKLSGTTSAVIVEQADHLAFAEMIAAAIRAKLRNLFEEVGESIRTHPFETKCGRVAGSVMTNVRRVFATLRPFQRNAERVQHFRRRTLRDNFHAEPSPTLRALRADRWPRPGPVGVRSRIASMSARRMVLSVT